MVMPEFMPVEIPPAGHQADVSRVSLNQETSFLVADEPVMGIVVRDAHALWHERMSLRYRSGHLRRDQGRSASDNWDPIRDAVTEVHGVEYLHVHDGRGRPTSESAFVPRQDLKYVQVVKERDEHGNLKKVVTRMVFGDPVEIRASLAISGSRGISTSSVERQNLSVRNYGRRFVRRTICFSKDGKYLKWYLEVLQAWFNFTKTNRSLRVRNSDGSFTHRTPAMAQGLADRPLTWKDIPRWRCN